MRLDRDDLVDFVNKNPAAALRIIAEMSERLRQTNELMSRQVSRNVLEEEEERLTVGQRVADRVAAFGGSWPFIFLFGGIMFVWMGVNIAGIAHFDLYPFILLNLGLSGLASQAPIIMMSQNRQSAKDKLLAENDYQVNLKAEMEIGALMRGQAEMMARIALIERATSKRASIPRAGRPASIPGPGPRPRKPAPPPRRYFTQTTRSWNVGALDAIPVPCSTLIFRNPTSETSVEDVLFDCTNQFTATPLILLGLPFCAR